MAEVRGPETPDSLKVHPLPGPRGTAELSVSAEGPRRGELCMEGGGPFDGCIWNQLREAGVAVRAWHPLDDPPGWSSPKVSEKEKARLFPRALDIDLKRQSESLSGMAPYVKRQLPVIIMQASNHCMLAN